MAIQNIGGYNTDIVVENFIKTGDGLTVNGDTISLTVAPQLPFQYFGAKSLNISNGSTYGTVELLDGTSLQAVVMDYDKDSIISIDTVALNDLIPRVTIFWLATAETFKDTVFATNSGVGTTMPSKSVNLWSPSHRTNAGYLYNEKNLFLGGDFTALGNSLGQHRFGVVDLSAGTSSGLLGTTGRPLTANTIDRGVSLSSINFVGGNYVSLSSFGSPLSSARLLTNKAYEILPTDYDLANPLKWNLQFDGSVNVIKRWGKFLVIGGAFNLVTINSYDRVTKKWGSYAFPSGRLLLISLKNQREKYQLYAGANGQYSLAGTSDDWYQPVMYAFNFNNVVYDVEVGGGTGTGEEDDETNNLFVGGAFTNTVVEISRVGGVTPFPVGIPTFIPKAYLNVTERYDYQPFKLCGIFGLYYNNVGETYESVIPGDNFIITYLGLRTSTGGRVLASGIVRTLKYVNGILYAGGLITPFDTKAHGRNLVALKVKSGEPGRMFDWYDPEYPVGDELKWDLYNFNNEVYTINYDPVDQVMYVGGKFTSFNKLNTTEVYAKPYLTAFDFSLSSARPIVFNNWNTVLNNYVSNVTFDDSSLYSIGAFTKAGVNSRSRIRCAAFSKPSNFGNLTVLDWTANLAGGGADPRDKLLIIPKTNPLSGIMIFGNYTSVNTTTRSHFSRVIAHNQTIAEFTPKTVIWEMYGKVVNNQTNISLDTENVPVAVLSSATYQQYILNSSSFPIDGTTEKIFDGVQAGTPLRIIIKRAANTGTYYDTKTPKTGRVWLLGARIDYDTKNAYDLYLDSLVIPLGITKQMSSLSAALTQSVTLSVALSGSEPIDYDWYLNDTFIPAATSNVYLIASLQNEDEGTYYVVANNTKNTVYSAPATLYINPVGFTLQPVGSSLVYGTSATLSVDTSGVGVVYKWYLNNTLIPSATGTDYPILSAVDSYGGAYTVVATNFFRSVTSTPVVITINNLQITVDLPSSKTVPIGGTTNLSIEYVGRTPLTVQWLSGTSSGTTTTPIVGPNNLGPGYYKAVVTNGVGSQVTSNICYIYQV